MKKSLLQLGEFGLIESISRNITTASPVIKGIGDDTAVIKIGKDNYQLLTTDMLLEGRHFSHKEDAQLIGQKAINCSVSDIAAMGGKPKYALISMGIPRKTPVKRIKEIYKGVKKASRRWGITIVGGDTVESKTIVINVALTGLVKKNHLVLRSGAQHGDWLFVTGALGGSFKSGKHLKFIPRLKKSTYLVNHFKPTSMIDVSDGLAADLSHILKESQRGAVIVEDWIPKTTGSKCKNALYDGEDFELVFTLKKAQAAELLNKKHPFKFYQIGYITDKKKGLMIKDSRGKIKPVKEAGFDHFKSK